MLRTAITLKLKKFQLLDEACSWAEKVFTDLPPLVPDEDNNFGDSLVLDFRRWWCHVQPKNITVYA